VRGETMIQFKQIEFKEAMDMIASDDIKNLFFQKNGDIVCIEDYQMQISVLKKKIYFKKEEIK
jgi:hypothetical protein